MSRGPILVVGGGMAGLAAALAAAKRGEAVVVCESAGYPRDKVCGEFLSAEVTEDLEAIGCGEWTSALGAIPLRRVLLTAPARSRGASPPRLTLDLPGPPGWAVTRRAIESWLAERARAAGVTVHERAPVRALEPHGKLFRWRAGSHEGETAHAIAAFGKRSSLDGDLALPRSRRPEQYSAAKCYFEAPPEVLEREVELHLVPGGYVGLNPVEGGRIALCALLDGADRESGVEPGSRPLAWPALRERFAANPVLSSRLDRLGEPSAAVRGLARFGFGSQRLCHAPSGATGPVALLCGDAARMMPSFTGDGMAVALRSGRLAAAALAARDPAADYARAYQAEFGRRIAVANVLHRVFFHPGVFAALAPHLDARPALTQRIYEWTRGGLTRESAAS